MPESHWYVLHVRSQHEKLTAAAAEDVGFVAFYPSYCESVKWSDRQKSIERPLFPGYVFVRFELDSLSKILQTKGVVRVLGGTAGPIAVSDSEVDAIRALLASGRPLTIEMEAHEYVPGQKVTVIRGSFRGVEGVIQRLKGKTGHRLVISVPLLNRSVSTELDDDAVRPA